MNVTKGAERVQFVKIVFFIVFLLVCGGGRVDGAQKEIYVVGLMPDLPHPLKMRDWAQVAQKYDELVFHFSGQGPYFPLIQWDRSQPNLRYDSFFLPSYVGDFRQQVGSQEAVTTLGAVVGASLVGVDKSDQEGHNWVLTQKQFFNHSTGQNRILNYTQVFEKHVKPSWYDIFPAMLFFMLVDQYPETAVTETALTDGTDEMSMEDMMYATARYYLEAVDTWEWDDIREEPDVLGGAAWLLYMAYQKFGEEQFLERALQCLETLTALDKNPFYEVLLPYGALAAARINREWNVSVNQEKLIEWSFGPSDARKDWGVLTETWGIYPVHGLQGSLTDGGGYGFSMNSFHMAGALAPLPRYDSRYAKDIGKWLLNLANSARLFYPAYLPLDHQSSPEWAEESQNVVAYEGLRKESQGKTPFGTGDAVRFGWAATDYALYGASHVGFLGSLIEETNEPGILKIDVLATDHFRAPAYPSYLFYNPYGEDKTVTIDVGPGAVDLYDTVSKQFIMFDEQGSVQLTIPGKTASVIVLVPADGLVEYVGNTMLLDGVVVDYQVNQMVITDPKPFQFLSGKVSLELDFSLSPTFVMKDVQVLLNGKPAALGGSASRWELDTSMYPNGEYELLVQVTGEEGVSLQDRIPVRIHHGILGSVDADDLANWKPLLKAPAEVEIRGKMITFKNNRPDLDWVGVISPILHLDLEQEPVLAIDGVRARGPWFIQLITGEPGNEAVYKVQPASDGTMFWSIQDVLRTKTGSVRLQIVLGIEQESHYISFFRDSIDLYYKRGREGGCTDQ